MTKNRVELLLREMIMVIAVGDDDNTVVVLCFYISLVVFQLTTKQVMQ